MHLAIFPDNNLGHVYFSRRSGDLDLRRCGKSAESIPEKNVILCEDDPDLLLGFLNQGRNVLYPFPLFGRVEELAEPLARHGTHLVAGSIDRYLGERRDIGRSIAGGRIGSVGAANICRKSGDPPGHLLMLLAREVDVLIRWFGRIGQVYAMRRQSGSTALMLVTLRFRNRTIVNLEVVCGFQGKPYEKGELCGTDGIIKYDSRQQNPLLHVDSTGMPPAEYNNLLASSEPHACQIAEFLQCIKGTGKGLAEYESHIYLSAVLSAVGNSVIRNRAVVPGGGEADE